MLATNFHNRSTETLNYRIYTRLQSSKQDDQIFISTYIDRCSYLKILDFVNSLDCDETSVLPLKGSV